MPVYASQWKDLIPLKSPQLVHSRRASPLSLDVEKGLRGGHCPQCVLNLLHWEPGGLRLHGLRSGCWSQKCLGTPISDGDRVPVEPSKIIRHLMKLNLYINSNNKNRTNPIKRSREEMLFPWTSFGGRISSSSDCPGKERSSDL